MKLKWVRLCNFQSSGPTPLRIDFDNITFLLGPNGAGKTALLQALARMFGADASLRRLRRGDFHVPVGEVGEPDGVRTLWVEAQFEFPELLDDGGLHATVPGHFAHMQLEAADGVPRVRIRLTGTLDVDGEIEESMQYVLQEDAAGEPQRAASLHRAQRSLIQVHYLPARRDPADHIAFTANSLLGRTLRAADWTEQREAVAELAKDMSEEIRANAAIEALSGAIATQWGGLHSGTYYREPQVSLTGGDIEVLLKQMSVGFGPAPGESLVDFKRLSDGQQSLLYLSLVLGIHAAARDAMAAGKSSAFDLQKLRPAVFTLIAMEEPENSLSPHYLGRVVTALRVFAANEDGQAVVATHSPSMLRRVPPETVRYLRLDTKRQTAVATITLPADTDEAHKFVREAVQAYPELYFSRMVILGEGASEEIVLPRILAAKALPADNVSVAIAPLGGRHVNHFWRLLNDLGIPHVTLLDLDRGRHQGGWGRVKYAASELLKIKPDIPKLKEGIDGMSTWDSDNNVMTSEEGKQWREWLREHHGVHFSSPLDLDFAMLREFPGAYGVTAAERTDPDAATIAAVLGKGGVHADHYAATAKLFGAYRKRFKDGSKPVNHLEALAALSDKQLLEELPQSLEELVEAVQEKLTATPE
ncbi:MULTISPECIES: AAA family ATPase [Hydrogenophaga]|uniref:AAA family ATPase n=1 Tax=Hydrogenophaga TaxID=47420 RepID=UPI001ACBA371|nr:AAA family ATPase [Hydrogenophaga sp.]MBN9371711.1 AAA family ATPase [Hydrogenophaga sp.]